jgi:hypothetical protein
MRSMNIDEKFIGWVMLLFGNVSATINLNGQPGSSIKIERRVRQGCPFAPYLFLIVGEVLTHTIKKAVSEGQLKGIYLLGDKK